MTQVFHYLKAKSLHAKWAAVFATLSMAAPAHAVCTQANCDSYNFEVPVSITNTSAFPALTVMGGEVGLGTLTPEQALHILGSGRLEGVSSTGTFLDFVIADATTNFKTTRFGTETGGDFVFQSVDDTYLNPVTRLKISRNGQIGIGTDNPIRALHIETTDGIHLSPSPLPSSPVAGDLAIDSGDSNKLKFFDGANWIDTSGGSGGGGGGSVTVDDIQSGAGLYLTYAPNNMPCSAGQTLKWQNSRWECGNDDSASGPLTTKGDLLVHNGTSVTRLPAGSPMLVLGTNPMTASGLQWVPPYATDLATVFGTGIVQRNGLASFSTVTVSSPLTHMGSTLGIDTISSTAVIRNGGNSLMGAMSIGPSMTYPLHLTTNGQNRITISNDGAVGVGTGSPARLLHVNGLLRLTPQSLPSSADAGDIALDADDDNLLKYYDGTSWVTAGAPPPLQQQLAQELKDAQQMIRLLEQRLNALEKQSQVRN